MAAPQDEDRNNSTIRPSRHGRQLAHATQFLILNESSCVKAHTLLLDSNHLGGIMRG
jgi:hypothetical protein